MEKFFNEIKNTADKVAKKSGELVELSRVKLNMANTKSEISTNFKVLGEMVYLSQKEGTEPNTEKIEEVLRKIDELYEKLEELSGVSSVLKNEKLCPVCTKSNPLHALFCCACGYQFDQTAEKEDE